MGYRKRPHTVIDDNGNVVNPSDQRSESNSIIDAINNAINNASSNGVTSGVVTRGGSPGEDLLNGTYKQKLFGLALESGDPLSLLLASMGTGSDDFNAYILQTIINRLSNQETRKYNEGLLKDQRLYDSPINQLARLMGAGISRDASIQMLSGSGGSGGSLPYGVDPSAATLTPPSQTDLAQEQINQMKLQNVFSGISAVGGLVGLGMNMASAITQIKAQSIANLMSQKTLEGLNASDQVMSSLQNAVSSGVLTTDDIDGFSNATDALNYINDHQDTDAFKSLFQSGSFQKVYGTKLGRDMFTQTWDSVRKSKDAGTLMDQYIKQQIAASELSQLDIKKGYTDIQYAIGELSRQDVEIQKIWNDVWEGNVRIEIAGQELKLKKNEVAITNNSVVRSNNEQSIYDAVMSGKESDSGTIDLSKLQGSGNKLLAMSTWCDLYDAFNKAYVMAGNANQRFNWEVFYQNNADAAKFMSGIQLTASQIQANAINPDLNPLLSSIMSMYLIGRSTGAFDMLKIGSDVVRPTLPYIFTPNKAQ